MCRKKHVYSSLTFIILSLFVHSQIIFSVGGEPKCFLVDLLSCCVAYIITFILKPAVYKIPAYLLHILQQNKSPTPPLSHNTEHLMYRQWNIFSLPPMMSHVFLQWTVESYHSAAGKLILVHLWIIKCKRNFKSIFQEKKCILWYAKY